MHTASDYIDAIRRVGVCAHDAVLAYFDIVDLIHEDIIELADRQAAGESPTFPPAA